MNMLNITVDSAKVPSLPTQRSPGYWQTVLRRLSRDALVFRSRRF